MKLLAFSRFPMAIAALVIGIVANFGIITTKVAAEPPVVAIIDQEEVFRKSLAGRNQREQIVQINEAIMKDKDAEMVQLKTEMDNLIQQKALLPADQYKTKQIEMMQKQKFIDYKYEKELTVLNEQVRSKLMTQLLPIIQEIMVERNATMLFENSYVMMAASEYDITPEAIKRLDARSPKIKVERILFKDLVAATQERMKKLQEAQKKANNK